MILFPNAKINIGLYVTERRHDGYHNLSTVMIPVGWRDVLELTPAKNGRTTLKVYGRHVNCPPKKNLVMKAYQAMNDYTGGLPPVEINLEKIIPDGAGMGGGSSDAAFTLIGLNKLFNIGFPDETLAQIAVTIGADCPFFIYNRPALCEGIGDKISFDIHPNLNDRSILIAKPKVAAVSTKEAYAGISPHPSNVDLRQTIALPPDKWQHLIRNDFEASIFPKLPEVETLKTALLTYGADYAAMTGSGSAVFGIFKNDKLAQYAYDKLSHCDRFVTNALHLND